MDSFSCILFLRQLHLDLNMYCFINFTLKITTFFDQEKFGRALLLYIDVKMTPRCQKFCQNRPTDIMHESRLTPFM